MHDCQKNVVMSNGVCRILHTCKNYNILVVGRDQLSVIGSEGLESAIEVVLLQLYLLSRPCQ